MRLVLTICATLLSLTQARDLMAENSRHPVVGNWTEAKWFTGLVKIPTAVVNSTLWYGNLIGGKEQ